MELYDVQAGDYLNICRGLVAAGPSSVHMLGLLLAPCIVRDGATQEELLHRISTILSSDDFHLKVIGEAPVTSGGNFAGRPSWGLAAVALGGGRGTTPARGHFWLSSESDISYNQEGGAVRASAEQIGIFRTALEEFIIPTVRSAGLSECMLHSLNECWKGVLGDMNVLEVIRDNPCVKSTKLISSKTRTSNDMIDGYIVRSVQDSDIKTIRAANKISFQEDYLLSRAHISAVVATSGGEAASWALTHDDLSIAALHTSPSHRRAGLASIVLRALCGATVEAIDQCTLNPYAHNAPIWMHGDCEAGNLTARRWFEAQGFQPMVKNTWILFRLRS